MTTSHAFVLKQLGLQDYETVWRAMKSFTDTRQESTVDEVWFVQHHPVFTQGQAGKEEHVLQYSTIPVVKTDRGGQVTYHGPGQLVMYVLVNLKRKNISVRHFISLMEQAVISLLSTYGIAAELKSGAPGVYVGGKKIASLGLRVRKGCTYHGVSLNVGMDLSPFQQINPCGYQGLLMTQISDLVNTEVSTEEVAMKWVKAFEDLLS